MNRLLALAKKELLQLKRDRMTLAMMIMLPIVQMLLFGWAINTDVRHIPTVVFDQDRSAQSRDLARRMNGDLEVTSKLGEGSAFTLTLPKM